MTRIISVMVALFLPLAATAAMNSDKMAEACKAANPGCEAYSMGGADRFWLVTSKHENCDVASDTKTLSTLKKAITGDANLYAGKPVRPSVNALLDYLNKNKLQSCALTTNFEKLTALCVNSGAEGQLGCHAYIAGVVDVAVEMDKQNQLQVKKVKTYQTPFCEKGKRKPQISDEEIIKAIAEYGQTSKANAEAGAPAAKVVMEALLTKYSCKNAPAKTEKSPAKKPEKK